jgi:hypothetical protein
VLPGAAAVRPDVVSDGKGRSGGAYICLSGR